VSDAFETRAAALGQELSVAVVAPEQALTTPCDILAPCALGGVFDDETIPRLACRAIVGAANNQLGAVGADRELARRGILYAPDFVVNAGGIINIAEEFVGYDRDRALARVAGIEDTTARVLAAATRNDVSPLEAAERIARDRIRSEGSGRWEPGSPTAWTNGEPLTSLRPVAPFPR